MSLAWADNFSFDYFTRMLQTIKSRFELRLLGEGINPEASRPQLFLRHDVDVSLKRALMMAEIENQCGVCATYMVIPSSLLYDLEAKSSRLMLRQLVDQGHELGMHFDVDDDGRSNGSSLGMNEDSIYRAGNYLGSLIDTSVKSISFHRPMPHFLRGPMTICGMVNAYADRLMACYISDSKGSWKAGEPLPLLINFDRPIVQLLIHPIWWGKEHMSPEDRLQEFFETEIQEQSHEFASAFDTALTATVPGVRRNGLSSRKKEGM